MKTFNTNQLIKELKTITASNIAVINKKCVHLNIDQLNWRPMHGAWNIIEVLWHLNEYAKYYHPTFESKIENAKFRDFKEIFTPSPLGRSAWKSMKLGRAKNIKRKFKAPKPMNPTFINELHGENELTAFIEHQEKLLTLLDKSNTVNWRKTKVPISISKLVRLRLGDALMFVIYHNERHIQQIVNILIHPNFPKKK